MDLFEAAFTVAGGVLAILGVVYSLDILPALRSGLHRSLVFGLAGGLVAGASGLALSLLPTALTVLDWLLDTSRPLDWSPLAIVGPAVVVSMEGGLAVGIGVGLVRNLDTRTTVSRRRNRILAGVTVAVLVVDFAVIGTLHSGPLVSAVVLGTLFYALIAGALVDAPPPTAGRHVRRCLLLVAAYLAVRIVRIVAALALDPRRVPGLLIAVEGMTSIFTVSMLGIVTPGTVGYILANRSAIVRTGHPPSFARFAGWWLAGLASGLALPWLPVPGSLSTLTLSAALIGFFVAAAHGEGRRILSEPRVRHAVDPGRRRMVPLADNAVSWRRFQRALLVIGGYVGLVYLFVAYGDWLNGGGLDLGVSDLAFLGPAGIVAGATAGFFYGWGHHLVHWLDRAGPRSYAVIGAVMTVLGIVVTLVPALRTLSH